MNAMITSLVPRYVSTARTRLADQLGPFQKLWEAWDEADAEICSKPLSHFETVIKLQFEELKEHRDAGDHDAAAREAVDIISVALNLMRWMQLKPDQIADIAQLRAERRMRGQVLEILDKYEKLHDI